MLLSPYIFVPSIYTDYQSQSLKYFIHAYDLDIEAFHLAYLDCIPNFYI